VRVGQVGSIDKVKKEGGEGVNFKGKKKANKESAKGGRDRGGLTGRGMDRVSKKPNEGESASNRKVWGEKGSDKPEKKLDYV